MRGREAEGWVFGCGECGEEAVCLPVRRPRRPGHRQRLTSGQRRRPPPTRGFWRPRCTRLQCSRRHGTHLHRSLRPRA
eukprot:363692-Chlamydomonas_euryale.AAC.3